MEETIVLTSKLLHALATHPSGCGFTKKQVAAMGYSWPPPRRWLKSLIGVEVTKKEYDYVFHLGDAHRKRHAERSLAKSREAKRSGWALRLDEPCNFDIDAKQ